MSAVPQESPPSALLTAALKYASKGWAVLPLHTIEQGRCTCGTKGCRSPGKHPRTEHGVDDASSDKDQIAAWWKAWPEASIGLACGEPSGLFVLDVDAKAPKGNGRSITGIDALHALELRHGKLPDTLETSTGGGGRHLFFRLPTEHVIQNRVSVKGPEGQRTGLDVRSTGGYVVLPPSRHVSGGQYKLAKRLEIVDAPDWLLRLIEKRREPKPTVTHPRIQLAPSPDEMDRERRYALGALNGACNRIVAAGAGERHDVLIREASIIAGYVIGGRGITHQEAYTELVKSGLAAGKDPREVERTVTDGLRYGEDTPRFAPARASTPADPMPDDKAPPPEDEDLGVDHTAVVHADLRHAKSGLVKGDLHNACTILELDPCYKGRLRLNLFTKAIELDGAPIVDGLEVSIRAQVNTEYAVHFGKPLFHDAIVVVAGRNSYDPLREYLDGVRWDAVPRIQHLLSRYFGSPASLLMERYSARFLVSAVARAFVPAAQVDTILVLRGRQGARKSTGLRALVPKREWFTDDTIDVQSKEGAISILGKWMVEVAELESFRGKAQSAIKAYITRRVDHFRSPYAINAEDHERRTVFVGTTNAETFLADPTGARRYWIAEVGDIDIAAIERDRDQLWAEAVSAWRAGEQWHLTDLEEGERADASEVYQVVEPWEHLIGRWLESPEGRSTVSGGLTTTDVMRLGLGLDAAKMTRQAEMTVADILRRMGFQRRRLRGIDGVRGYRYQR